MAFKKWLNLPTPSDPYEAVRKEYVDRNIDINRIFVVHSNYCGLLRKGEYQFVLG